MSEGKPLVEDENSTLDKIIHYFPYFAVPIGILMLAAYFFNFHSGFGDQGDFGAFGDFFGGILNPMLSFLTILLLLRQLRYQRSELKATAAELRTTAEIHRENIRHNRAVDIYEKTNDAFDKSLSNFYESLRDSFVKIPASETDVLPTGGLKTPEDKSFRATNYEVSLEMLLPQFGLVRSILYSDKAEKFTRYLISALNRTVQHGYQIYTLANAYQQLEVNNLLYLEKFKRFNDRLKRLHDDINSLELENGALQIDEVINALVHQSESLIIRANDTPNLD